MTAKLNSPSRSRWAVGSAFFLHGMCFSSWGARIPTIKDTMNLSDASLGSVLFAIPIGSILSMPLATYLVQKYGSRRVLIVGLSLYLLLLTTLGLARTPVQLALCLIFFGCSSNMVNVAVNTQAVNVESLLKKTVMASLHGLWSLAGFVAAAIGAVMIGLKIEPALHFAIVICALFLILVLNQKYFLEDAKSHSLEKAPLFSWPDKNLMGLGLIAFCSMICEGAMFDWSGVYFSKVIEVKPEWVGFGYASFMSTMAGTRFIADGLTLRFGIDRILKFSGIAIALGLMISVIFPVMSAGIIGFLLVGSGTSAVVPLVLSEAGRASSTNRSASAAIAAVSTIGFLGFLVGPPMIGWIAGATSLRVSFTVIAVMGLGITYFASKQFPKK